MDRLCLVYLSNSVYFPTPESIMNMPYLADANWKKFVIYGQENDQARGNRKSHDQERVVDENLSGVGGFLSKIGLQLANSE